MERAAADREEEVEASILAQWKQEFAQQERQPVLPPTSPGNSTRNTGPVAAGMSSRPTAQPSALTLGLLGPSKYSMQPMPNGRVSGGSSRRLSYLGEDPAANLRRVSTAANAPRRAKQRRSSYCPETQPWNAQQAVPLTPQQTPPSEASPSGGTPARPGRQRRSSMPYSSTAYMEAFADKVAALGGLHGLEAASGAGAGRAWEPHAAPAPAPDSIGGLVRWMFSSKQATSPVGASGQPPGSPRQSAAASAGPAPASPRQPPVGSPGPSPWQPPSSSAGPASPRQPPASSPGPSSRRFSVASMSLTQRLLVDEDEFQLRVPSALVLDQVPPSPKQQQQQQQQHKRWFEQGGRGVIDRLTPAADPSTSASASAAAAPQLGDEELSQQPFRSLDAQLPDLNSFKLTNTSSGGGGAAGAGAESNGDRQSSHRYSTAQALANLAPFVPKLLKDEMASGSGRYAAFDGGEVRELVAASRTVPPSMCEIQLAIMIADVKGFTQLTEVLTKSTRGGGVELLTNCMNNYFTLVISMIQSYAGDVVKFAGDSMIVAFCPSGPELDSSQGKDQALKAATMRATRCAQQLALHLGHMRMKLNGQVEPVAHPPRGGAGEEEGVLETAGSGEVRSPLLGGRVSEAAAFQKRSSNSHRLAYSKSMVPPKAAAAAADAAAAAAEGAADVHPSLLMLPAVAPALPSRMSFREAVKRATAAAKGQSLDLGSSAYQQLSQATASVGGGGAAGGAAPGGLLAGVRGKLTGLKAAGGKGGKLGPLGGGDRNKSEPIQGAGESAATLWGEGGAAQRQISVASRLALPPPLHMLRSQVSNVGSACSVSSPASSAGRIFGIAQSSMVDSRGPSMQSALSSNMRLVRPPGEGQVQSWQSTLQNLTSATLTRPGGGAAFAS